MSARLVPIGWTPAKRTYDAVVVVASVAYVLAYVNLAPLLAGPGPRLDPPSVSMKAFGSLAFLLLTIALAIGPLVRLDRRFLPLLYNRRHLGVVTFLVALSHAVEVLGWYFAFSPVAPLVALLSSEPLSASAPAVPFIPLGVVALLILFALAATSHDFWLAFLTPPRWKALHRLIYLAYAFVVAHVSFGYLQSAAQPGFALVVLASVGGLVALHLAAARRDRAADYPAPTGSPWFVAGRLDDIVEGRAIVARPPGAPAVAIFRHKGRLSAVGNLCAHQNGPLGEGCVIGGLITCPWHGFQYRLEDGRAPAPYTERLPTYNLRLQGRTVLFELRSNPPGTRVEPLLIPGSPA